MARSAALIAILILAGCQSVTERAEQAAAQQGIAQAAKPFPDLSAACTAKVGRVKPGTEPWVVTFRRWEVVADNRDREAEDCAAWGRDMKSKGRGD